MNKKIRSLLLAILATAGLGTTQIAKPNAGTICKTIAAGSGIAICLSASAVLLYAITAETYYDIKEYYENKAIRKRQAAESLKTNNGENHE